MKKLKHTFLLIGGVLFFPCSPFAQTTYNTLPVNPPGPNHDVLYGQTGIMTIMGGSYGGGSAALNSCGINIETPHYMLDIYGGDANVSSANNMVGYRIGGQLELYTDGDPTTIYVGLQTTPSFTSSYQFNTCMGYYAGRQINGGTYNTVSGAWTGYNISNGSYNTFTGMKAGYFTNGGTFPAGCYNTMTGYQCGYNNYSGYTNSYYGKLAAYNNNGADNCMYGAHSGNDNQQTDSNAFYGTYSNYYGTVGNDNVYVGMDAALKSGDNSLGYAPSNYNVYVGGLVTQHNPSGNYNIAVGYEADAYTGTASSPGTISNAVAIGAGAVVNQNNSIILGNNNQWTGIGLSYSGGRGYPNNSLEICSRTQAGSSISNSSGLRFTNLTASSPTVTNPGSGVLALNANGDVIYVPGSTSGGGIGYCPTPLSMTSSGGFNMSANGVDFYFEGQNTNLGLTDVSIGNTCSYIPKAKLDVYQNSGTTTSIGAYIENDDAPIFLKPSIGIKSYMKPYQNCYDYNVAGWFESDGSGWCIGRGSGYLYLTTLRNYALFVPSGGGTEDIGYSYLTDLPDYLLDVNGYGRTLAGVIPSDTILKRNVISFTYGLKAIRSLNTYSYQYNGKGGFDTTYTYVGFIAQNLERTVPDAVVYSSIIKDTLAAGDTEMIGNVYEQAVLCTAINAIKQLDSTVTSNHKNDSTIQSNQQQTIDSLRTVLTSIQSCLSTLCGTSGESHSATQHSNGNPIDSSSIDNSQVITLSALGSVGAPLLYQNSPNPFSTGTKINYYLPQGTVGATIVFYDTYGNQLKTIQLNQTGNGTLNITPDNLSNGIYSYSLIVNGSVIDTKRMILQK